MTRFILIENASGYIWGDSADLNGAIFPCPDAIAYAAALDASFGEHGRIYDRVGPHDLTSEETGYHVYRADVDGSDAVPIVHDGQDRETIRAVVRDCLYVG
jgi:hypothetical protein